MTTQEIQVAPEDVLCGKDKKSFNHLANKKFRDVVQFYLERYKNAKKRSEKAEIADAIGAACTGGGGRFLRPDESGAFRELDRRGIREKITHALRDAVRKQMEGRTQREKRNLAAQKVQARASSPDGSSSGSKSNSPLQRATSGGSASAGSKDATATRKARDLEKRSEEDMTYQAMLMRRNNFVNQQQQQAAAQAQAMAMAQRANGFGPGAFPRNPMNPFAVGMGAAGMGAAGAGMGAGAIDLTADEQESMSSARRKVAAQQMAFEEQMMRKQQQMMQQHQRQMQQQQQAMMASVSTAGASGTGGAERVPALMEQIRSLQMMAAMRDQEMGSLRMALCDATASAAAKDKEIAQLKEELGLKDRALRTSEKRAHTEDPPEDPPTE